MTKRKAGRPFVWPWKTTPVGRGFYLSASTRESAMSSVSRARRLWGVEYTVVTANPSAVSFFVRRLK